MAWKNPKNAKCKKQRKKEKTVKTTSNDCIKAWPKKSKDYVDYDWNFFPMVLKTFTNTKPNNVCFANNREF